MLTKKDIKIPKNPPKMIVIVGPCRVGTTALANTFAKAGITTYMQPIKSARRAKEERNKIVPWIIKQEDFALSKETIGPDTPAEFFNPIQILLDGGYPKEKLKLIPILRDPIKTLASWKDMWNKIDLEKFVQSYKLTKKIKNDAEAKGIKVIPYVHEMIRDQKPIIVIRKLFEKLGIKDYFSRSVTKWNNGIKFGEKNPNLRFYDVPPEKFIKGVKEWGEYCYRDESYLRLSLTDARFLNRNKNLIKIYEVFRKNCQKSFGLKIKPYNSVKY